VPWRYLDGPRDAGGRGAIALSVPPRNFSCSWLVHSDSDGDWSIQGEGP
jgi:hypothetical protein